MTFMTRVLYLTLISSFFSSSEGLDQNCWRNLNQRWRKTRRRKSWNCHRCHCYCLQTRMRSPRSRCCLRKSHWKSWTSHCCCWSWRRTWRKTARAISATLHHSSPNRCFFLTCGTDQVLSRQCKHTHKKNTEISHFPLNQKYIWCITGQRCYRKVLLIINSAVKQLFEINCNQNKSLFN